MQSELIFFQAEPSKLTSSKPNFFTAFSYPHLPSQLTFSKPDSFHSFPLPTYMAMKTWQFHMCPCMSMLSYILHNMKKHNFDIWNKLLGIIWRNEKKRGWVWTRGMHLGFC